MPKPIGGKRELLFTVSPTRAGLIGFTNTNFFTFSNPYQPEEPLQRLLSLPHQETDNQHY